MKTFRSWAAPALAAALLIACGGGDPYVPGSEGPSGAPTTQGHFTAVVSFGTSLSDVGSYTPATAIPDTSPQLYWGGRFTTNGSGAAVWVENVATALGLAVTPAEVGFAGRSVKCPYVVACTAYGQGGALVTGADGYHHEDGFLTVPIKTQIANHLASFGSFKADDLILVEAGPNDIFVQMDAFVVKATDIQTRAALGQIPADQVRGLLLNAQLEAMGEIKKAALELAGYVKSDILAKGGKYVAVATVVDISLTPYGSAAPVDARVVLTGLSDNFNLWMREGLKGQPIQFIDLADTLKSAVTNPSAHHFANVTTPACDTAKISANTQGQITTGTSLFCNSTPVLGLYGLTDGADADSWLFADGVHPTTGGHKLFGEAALAQLKAFGWI